MNDVIGAIATFLRNDTDMAALVEDRVFVNRLPNEVVRSEDTFRPRKMVVVQMGGGVGKSDTIATDQPTINVLCYGESDLEADRVRRVVWDKFVHLSRVRVNSVLIHHINPVGGAIVSADPDIVWPIVSQSYQALASTET